MPVREEEHATEGFDWQVVVGRKYGTYVTTKSDAFAFFTILDTFVYVYQTKAGESAASASLS